MVTHIDGLITHPCGIAIQVLSHTIAWWRHQMETLSVLLALCEGNPPVTGGFPSHRPVTHSFGVFFDLWNKRLRKQSRHRRFEMPSRSLWRHRNNRSVSNSKVKLFWSSPDSIGHRSPSIRHRSDTSKSYRYLIDVDPRAGLCYLKRVGHLHANTIVTGDLFMPIHNAL